MEPNDACWELEADHPLAATQWYRGLDARERRSLGLDLVVASMQQGIAFENILQRGLLRLAASMPSGSSTSRYAYHEVIEEAHHSLMFQEFINRTRVVPAPLPWFERMGAEVIVWTARVFPALFMFFVLAGEEPIDVEQKRALRSGRPLHPLLERVMQIHVLEEARHLSFARKYLEEEVPKLNWWSRLWLRLMAPGVVRSMAKRMFEPPRWLVAKHQIPKATMRRAYAESGPYGELTIRAVAGVEAAAVHVGIKTPGWAWRWMSAPPLVSRVSQGAELVSHPMPQRKGLRPAAWAWPTQT